MIHYSDDDFEAIYNPSIQKVRRILSDWPRSDLEHIRVFRPEKSQALEQIGLPFFQKLYPYLFYDAEKIPKRTQDFDELKELKETVQSIEETKAWLATLAIPPQTEMIVSYDLRVALLMHWSLFAASYDRLCYSGLDDILIFSTSEQWYLLYYHEDIFLFGKRKEESEKVV